ncbi:MAG TPA: acyltransferase family protein [Burkholderiales bacterium]|nr:acyltransferase family protein [Burkholderiales bacterium]
MPPASPNSYQPHVDGLRAVAVLSVVAFHSFPGRITGGFVGVDIFFVISGFLISGIILNGLRQGSFTFSDFYARRIRRIFPALIVVLAATLILGYLFLFPSEFRNLGKHVLGGALFVANITLWRDTGYFDTAAELKPLLHLWSLGVEEQYYLLWPLFLLVCFRRRWNMLRMTAFICLASFAFNVWASGTKPIANFFLLPGRFWELMTGSMLAQLHAGGMESPGGRVLGIPAIRDGAAVAGLALIAAALLGLDRNSVFPGWPALLPTVGACLLIAAGPDAWINRRMLACRPVVFVGLISYPLYLWHWPLLAYGRIIESDGMTTATALTLVSAAFPLAWATYQWVEKPIRFGYRGSGKVVAALCASMGAMVLTGAAGFTDLLHTRLTTPFVYSIDRAIGDWSYPADDSNFKKSGDFWLLREKGALDASALFVGDSHMEQYWSRVKAVIDEKSVKTRSVIFATSPGCPPLPDVNRVDPGYFCQKFFEFAIETARRPDIDTVVFGAAWEAYFVVRNAEAHPRNPIFSTRDPSRATLVWNAQETGRIFAEFERRLEDLHRRGKRVILLLSNPSSRAFSPGSMLPSRLDPGRTVKRVPYVSKSEFADLAKPVADRLKAAAAAAGAIIVDPADYFCDKGDCPTTTPDGQPIYSDSNHIRPFYARQKALFIDRILID